MNEQAFHDEVDKLFLGLENWLEKNLSEIDFETEQGILTLTFPDSSYLILTRQTALQEIWWASKQGAYHFHRTSQGWLTQQQESLVDLLVLKLQPWSPTGVEITLSDLK